MKLTQKEIVAIRLENQQILFSKYENTQDLVSWMANIQAQDYASAKYAIGLRLNNTDGNSVEKAINDKEIIRTWPLRSTLHFVSKSDIRWLLSIQENDKKNSTSNDLLKLGFTEELVIKCRNIIGKSLSGKKELTRKELSIAFSVARIKLNSRQLYHLLYNLGREQFICFGNYRQKEVTFTLLNDWVPREKLPERKQLLAELAKRYFLSRGPATISDFKWWTGLSLSDIKTSLKMNPGLLQEIELDGETYFMPKDCKWSESVNNSVFLLPWFDEYILSYKKRESIIRAEDIKKVNRGGGMINPVLIIQGKVCGIWKRVIKKNTVDINITLFSKISMQEKVQTEKEAEKYASFVGKRMGQLSFKQE